MINRKESERIEIKSANHKQKQVKKLELVVTLFKPKKKKSLNPSTKNACAENLGRSFEESNQTENIRYVKSDTKYIFISVVNYALENLLEISYQQ